MKFVLKSKTSKDKSTHIFPPLLLKPPFICACAMLRNKKGQLKVQILKKTTVLWSSKNSKLGSKDALILLLQRAPS